MYKCTDYYNPNAEVSIKWNDNTLSIHWPNFNKPLLSEKDIKGESFTWETSL
ncbi:dTDP-4-keto-6-deoxyglucose 3,5-epimerase [Vibrio chagasii]|nr:dTDP-4-keto-6-deoxyglucose 3,5-epimerase [Vibrio chagasii]CAH7328300.1 dTDP-4-keto-6-deoxyglucose 3,5-epimerase [Vibrio chagasii]